MARRPVFLLAPGAGAPISHPWLRAWAERLSEFGDVCPFDYPYQQGHKRAPDPLPVLIQAHLAAAKAAEERFPEQPLFFIGKSMGGRIGCHASLERSVSGLICLGYPLKSPGKSGKLRDQVLLALRAPVLFVQGTRDPLCPLDELDRVLPKMSAAHELFVVEAGDHSLEVTKTALKRAGESQDQIDLRVSAAIRQFVERLV